MYKKVVPALLILVVFVVFFATPVFADDFEDSPFGWNGDNYDVFDDYAIMPVYNPDGFIPSNWPTYLPISNNIDSDLQLFYPNLGYLFKIRASLTGDFNVALMIWDTEKSDICQSSNFYIYIRQHDFEISNYSIYHFYFHDSSYDSMSFSSYQDFLDWIVNREISLNVTSGSVSSAEWVRTDMICSPMTQSAKVADNYINTINNVYYTSNISTGSLIPGLRPNVIFLDSSFTPAYGIMGPVGQYKMIRKYKYNTVLIGYSYDPNREKPYNLVSTAYLNYDDFNSRSEFRLRYQSESGGAHAYLDLKDTDYFGPKGIDYSIATFGYYPSSGTMDPIGYNQFQLMNYSFSDSAGTQGINYIVRYSDVPVVDSTTSEVIYDPAQGISPADQAILDKLDGIDDSIDKGFADMGDHIDDVKDEIHDVYYGDVHFTAPDDYQNSLDDANGSLEDFQIAIDNIKVPSVGTDIVEGIVNNIKAYKPIFNGVYGFWGSGYPGTLLGVAVFIWTLFEVIKLGKSFRRIKRKNIYVTKVYNQGIRME